MEFLVAILVLALLVGLLSRNKGDSFLDTLSSGCSTIIIIIIVIVVIAIIALNN